MQLSRRGFLGAAAVLGTGTPALAVDAPKEAPPERFWTSYYGETRVWAHVDRHSVVPGEKFKISMSTGPSLESASGSIEVFRAGNYPKDGRKHVATFKNIDVSQEKTQITAASAGSGWPVALEIVDTSKWAPGYYTFDFVDATDGNRDLNVAFIVVRSPETKVDVLVTLSTNTFQAYNAWGGYSFYESAYAGDAAQLISFDRPTPPDFFEYDFYFVKWLERLAARRGWKVGYATNFDIHRDPRYASDCKLLVSGSHNEYWSKEEFDTIYNRIFSAGKNTIFFGANSAYWQVRYADINGSGENLGRQLVCFKSVNDPICERVGSDEAALLKTAMFRADARRPETMLAGVGYQSYFDPASKAKYPYVVAHADLPFFHGTGLKVGESIGNIVGYEWDNRDPDGDGKRLWVEGTSKIPQLHPDRITVLFEGKPVDVNGKPGKAEAVYFTSEAGAKVFSSGSIRWAWGLGKPGFFNRKFSLFNANLISAMLAA